MKNIYKKYKGYIFSLSIPLVALLLTYILNKYYPFGDKLVAMIDGYSQYPGLLSNYLNSLKGNSSFFYSFKGLLGFNSYPTFVYYTFNITSLIALLFKNLMAYYNFIVIFKICLSSLTMFIFLNYYKKRKYNYLFSICYALSAYNLLYYFNYMWIDNIILLPLIILGIEKIFRENKYSYYLIFLTLSIIFNFYIGYMICIFSVIYFIYDSVIYKFNKERTIKYLVFSLLSGLLSSFALIPVILEILNGKASVISSTNFFKFDKDFINLFYKLTIGSFTNGDLEYGTPNVYVSLFIFINAMLYFFNNRIKLKTRITSLVIFLFFLLSVSFNLFDYAWHIFSMPIYYPVRYSFIIEFFLILLAFKNFIRYDKKSLRFNLIFYISLVVLIIIGFITSGNLIDKQNIITKIIYLGISFIFIIYYAFLLKNKNYKNFIVFILIIELTFNTFITIKNTNSTTSYDKYASRYNLVNENINKINDDDIYRIGVNNKSTNNNGLLVGYNDLSYFSSVRNSNVFNYTNKVLGFRTLDNCNTLYYYNNPVVNSLLNVRYIITESDLNYYDKLDSYLYKNNDATTLGFMTNKGILDLTIEDNFIDNFNKLIKTINNNDKDILNIITTNNKTLNCNKENNLCMLNGDDLYAKYEYTASKDEFIFINDHNQEKNTYEVLVNNELVKIDNKGFYLLHKNDKVTIKISFDKKSKDYDTNIYVVDYKLYKEFINNINESKLEIGNYYGDNHFTSKINVENDGLLYTSIAADNGWKVLVDGKEVKYKKIYDAVIGLELDKGEHNIEFIYTTPGLKIGIIISITTLLSILSIYLINKRTESE